MGHVFSLPELVETLASLRQQPNFKLVTTNGCFDLLHVGHLRYLQAARKLGDYLVVALNSDQSVQNLKGPSRPIVPETDRAELLAGLACVDAVVLFEDATPIRLLEAIQPTIHVKGAQYTEGTLPEAEVLKAMGTDIQFITMVDNHSTSLLIERIQAL
jgi:rfaE bifunctional protein nucleotidyltransferase chain/domain